MSGGTFDYSYLRVSDFADDLERHLDTHDEPDEWGDVAEPYSPQVREELRRIVADARRISRLMRAAEWRASGDTGDESFLEDVAEARREEI